MNQSGEAMTQTCPHGLPQDCCGDCNPAKVWVVNEGQYLCLYGGRWRVILNGGTVQLCSRAAFESLEINSGHVAPPDLRRSAFTHPVAVYVQREAYRP